MPRKIKLTNKSIIKAKNLLQNNPKARELSF
jgi:hypothetical protein